MEIYKNTFEGSLADIADADADDPARGVADADAEVARASATDDEAIASSSARLPLGATRDRVLSEARQIPDKILRRYSLKQQRYSYENLSYEQITCFARMG